MPFLLLLLGLICWGGSWSHSDDSSGHDRQSKALSAFSRGDALSWDQLEVVASQAGLSRQQIAEMKLKARVERLIQQFHLPLEVSGFSDGMDPDQEYRLFKSRRPDRGTLLLNAGFWAAGAGVYDTDAYLTYLLFRAEAYFIYRSHYDAEHGAWIVAEESPSMQVLRTVLDSSETRWVVDDGPPTGRDLEFRKQMDPSQNPERTLKALVEYALRAVAHKASDDWALERYRREVGPVDPLVERRVAQRERTLAWDYSRARGAMTRAERISFQKLVKSPFRFARSRGAPASEPVFDPEVTPRSVK